jgi:gliding motility-associated-like protein
LNNGPFTAQTVYNNLTGGNYSVIAKDNNSCTDTANIVLNIVAKPLTNINVTDSNSKCGLNNGMITVDTSKIYLPATFQLNNLAAQNTPNFQNLSAGAYKLHLVDSSGCTFDTTITVNATPFTPPQVTVNTPTTCAKLPPQGEINVIITGNFAPYLVSLNNAAPSAQTDFKGLSNGTYTLTIFDKNNCSIPQQPVTITSFPLPVISLQATPQPKCSVNSGGITIQSNPNNIQPVLFSLNNGPFTAQTVYNNLTGGNYSVIAKDNNGCTDTANIILNVVIKPVVNIKVSSSSAKCGINNGTIVVDTTNIYTPASFQLNNFVPQNTPGFLHLNAGTYKLHVVDSSGCAFDTSITVNAIPFSPPQVTINTTLPVCTQFPPQGEINIIITGNDNPYLVAFNNALPSAQTDFKGLSSGIYSITVFDKNNCTIPQPNDTLKTTILPECDTVFVPSSFTPNKDGRNDVFRPLSNAANITNMVFSIYNRFGNLIFSTAQLNAGWDGTYHGVNQNPGTYVWTLQYTSSSGMKRFFKGTVVLIR